MVVQLCIGINISWVIFRGKSRNIYNCLEKFFVVSINLSTLSSFSLPKDKGIAQYVFLRPLLARIRGIRNATLSHSLIIFAALKLKSANRSNSTLELIMLINNVDNYLLRTICHTHSKNATLQCKICWVSNMWSHS